MTPHVGLSPHRNKISRREEILNERFYTVVSQMKPVPGDVECVTTSPVAPSLTSHCYRSLHEDKSTALQVIGRRQARQACTENKHRRLSRRVGHARYLYQFRHG